MSATLRATIVDAAARLAAAGVPAAEHDAAALAAFVLGCTRGELAGRDAMDPLAADAYDALVARRATREPLQHITGTAVFRYVELAVGPGVFVPRPETESLAGWAIDAARACGRAAPVVLDLCTGSGAIALSVATEVPGSVVSAIELDPAAYDWASRNLAGSGVDLFLGDATAAATDHPDLIGAVDVVVSNPPYIPHDAWESVDQEVRDHDPALALWADGDGLAVIDGVARAAAVLLRPGGVFGVEHADVQGSAVVALLAATGAWTQVTDHPDLAGRDRFTTARRAVAPTSRTTGAVR